MAKAEKTEIFDCPPEKLFQVVTDYNRYAEFLPEVKSCRVVREESGRKLVEYEVSVIKTFKYRLWMEEEAPRRVQWNLESGDLFKKSRGSWTLVPEGGKTKARYEVEAEFNLFVPGPIAKTVINVNLPNMMAAYRRRLEDLGLTK